MTSASAATSYRTQVLSTTESERLFRTGNQRGSSLVSLRNALDS